MLATSPRAPRHFASCHFASRQQGVTLLLALVVLVAMLLSGIALFRTVDSGALVAGNIALQKSATRQGDYSTEDALNWLVSAGTNLYTNAGGVGHGYVANGINDVPGTNQTWAQWWTNYSATNTPVTMTKDPQTGNTVAYFIQRLCSAEGQPYTGALTCQGPPVKDSSGNSKGVGSVSLERPSAVYYRITSKITGPNNTVSFVQTIVAL